LKLINSTSFGESMFLAGFIHKTIKGDLFIEGNYGIPPRNQCGKTLENSRRQITEAETEALLCGAKQPHLQAGWPLGTPISLRVAMSFLHHILGCIYAVL